MEYRGLGQTGMQVSPLCLGAMMFGAGVNFIESADGFSLGESEEIVCKALVDGRRDDVIVATKFHGPMDVAAGYSGGDPNRRGNSRRWIIRAVENSLRGL